MWLYVVFVAFKRIIGRKMDISFSSEKIPMLMQRELKESWRDSVTVNTLIINLFNQCLHTSNFKTVR